MHDKKRFFQEGLMAWALEHPRPLPWKKDRDAYKIWLSEIILQQTRVDQGLPYYLRFVEKYPTVRDLAAAPDDAVFKLWEGLGYYTRARNLLAAARFVAERGGEFPDTFEGLRALRGVGDYTAAAIASFAFELPHAVVDGNVYRVLARYFGIEEPTDTPAAKRLFAALAQELLDPARPGAWNQAMMDFGATHCTPRLPKCGSCPLRPACTAFQTGRVELLPVKSKKTAKRDRRFLYAVFHHKGYTFVRKRVKKDIWQGLYDFPALEAETLPADTLAAAAALETRLLDPGNTFPKGATLALSAPFRQTLTHQQVAAVFLEITLPEDTPEQFFKQKVFENVSSVRWVELRTELAFPRLTERFLQQKATAPTLF